VFIPNVENDWDTYGLPETIVVDNGKEFYSTSFEDACLSLGIVIQYCPPKMPWYKSAIERYFGALNTQLLSHQPGKTFAKFMQQNDYDSKNNAVVSFDALQEILHIFIVDIYNQSGHPQLKSPRQKVWSKAIASFPPALPSSKNELSVLIGAIVERTVTRRGIEFEGLIYNCSELARLRSELEQNNLTKTTGKEAIVSEPTSLNGISNCEGAIATPSISPKLEAHSVKVIKSRTDLDLKLQQKDSELEFVDKVEVTQIAEIESAEKIKQTEVEVEDNWQPDLSGWSVFKGLSK
jgi:hypothetical protein